MSTSYGREMPTPEESVLSTLNEDGSRRWIRPKVFKGKNWKRRAAVAYGLIAIFTALPYVKIGGYPAILLDLPARRFHLFGATFLPTDTMFLMLLLMSIFFGIVLLTALLGRAWCGWACPQTVYMEFLYRPIEQWLEGGRNGQIKMDREGGGFRRYLKYVIFLGVSMFLAHTFLAYFVGVERLFTWVQASPAQHPLAFMIMAGVTALMFFDFAYFREQTCLIACPYGRFQSVLLDRKSLIVGYDHVRGEPRGKLGARKKQGEEGFGDCVDCNLCVVTCPTGIDIRKGLQMECIHCTQCMDACDSMMTKLDKPTGLIRYGSVDGFDRKPTSWFRPRLVIYPVILALVLSALGFSLARRTSADVTVLRGKGAPFTELASGEVSNQLRVVIVNRAEDDRRYAIEVLDVPGASVIAPENPLPVAAGDSVETTLFVNVPLETFTRGKRDIEFRVTDGVDFEKTFPFRLLGPYNTRRRAPADAPATGETP